MTAAQATFALPLSLVTMARKTETDSAAPRKKRFARLRQIGQVFNQSRRMDPTIPWWMLGAFLGVLAVFLVVGLILHRPVYFTILGVPLGALAAGILMARKAERAAYKQLEGQVGGGGAALGALRKGWYYDQQPVAVEGTRPGDLNAAAMVFRAVGRPGVVLVLEGPLHRARKLAESERKRINRVLPNVPVHLMRAGDGEDEVPLHKLASKISRMRPSLTKQEAAAVNKRLKALGAARPPVPKGIDPLRARPDRKGLRGR
jgi:Domain of unknown function (DUF4191)